jgi:hypothetical protein
MLMWQEILHGIIFPVLVSALIAAVGAWRKWAWAMPLAAGGGFIAGYALMGAPGLPPSNGYDWIFWLAMPLTVLGALDVRLDRKWGWIFGVVAGLVALIVLRPLSPAGVSATEMWLTVGGLAGGGAAMGWVASIAQKRLGPFWTMGAFCIVAGGVGVTIMSSGSRGLGIDGLALSAALGPVAVLGMRLRGARGVVGVVFPVLAGLLVANHFYTDPGVTWTSFIVLLASPVLLLIGVVLPVKRAWMRGVVALLAVTIAVAAVTGPIALTAKKAAEADPYGELYK